MPQARLKFKPHDNRFAGPYKFTTTHPNDEFRILSAYPMEDRLFVIVESTMADPATVVHFFDELSTASTYKMLHAGEQTVLLEFELPFIPLPYRALLTSENPPQFPQIIRDGWMICDLTTSQERLAQCKDELETTGFTVEVVSLTQSPEPIEILTSRQQQFVTTAIKRGYYDTPRGCSLTDLAATHDISKSTASEILHRAEGKIIKKFASESRI